MRAPSIAGAIVSDFARRRPVACFFTLACLIFWTGLLPIVVSRSGLGWLPVEIPEGWVFPLTYSPTAAALLTHWFAERNLAAFRVYGSCRRILMGAAAGSMLILGATVVLPALLLAQNPLRDPHWRVFLSGNSFALTTLVGGGPLGEEAGWRGYALPRLQSRMSAWKAALVIGALWACWHFPMFLVRGFESSGFIAFAAVIVCISVTMTLVANISRFSVAAAVLAHFALNSSGGLYAGLIAGSSMRAGLSQEVVMPLSVFVTAVILVLATRGRLASSKPPFRPPLF